MPSIRRMLLKVNALARLGGRCLPEAAVRRISAWLAAQGGVALCMHRVRFEDQPGPKRPNEPAMTIPAETLDQLIGSLRAARPGERGWLTVSFDDGYADSARYVLERASRFPEVEWVLFVCPEKLERRVGFRWDLPIPTTFDPPYEPERENAQDALAALAELPEYALATVEQCRALARLPNVTLGDHTNSHLPLSKLTPEQAARELTRSKRDFERLFGACTQLAIPFGTPEIEFTAANVEAARALGPRLIWSTEARTYRPEERVPGAVLPRFPVDGTMSVRQILLWMALSTLRARLRPRITPTPGGLPGADSTAKGTAAASV